MSLYICYVLLNVCDKKPTCLLTYIPTKNTLAVEKLQPRPEKALMKKCEIKKGWPRPMKECC